MSEASQPPPSKPPALTQRSTGKTVYCLPCSLSGLWLASDLTHTNHISLITEPFTGLAKSWHLPTYICMQVFLMSDRIRRLATPPKWTTGPCILQISSSLASGPLEGGGEGRQPLNGCDVRPTYTHPPSHLDICWYN